MFIIFDASTITCHLNYLLTFRLAFIVSTNNGIIPSSYLYFAWCSFSIFTWCTWTRLCHHHYCLKLIFFFSQPIIILLLGNLWKESMPHPIDNLIRSSGHQLLVWQCSLSMVSLSYVETPSPIEVLSYNSISTESIGFMKLCNTHQEKTISIYVLKG